MENIVSPRIVFLRGKLKSHRIELGNILLKVVLLEQTIHPPLTFGKRLGKSCRVMKGSRQRQSPGGVLQKKAFLKILQNSQENTCVGVSFLIKLQT